MVAARRQRHDARLLDAFVEAGEAVEAVLHVGGVGRDVADIGAVDELERPHAGGAVFGADHGREIAQLAGAVAGPGAVGRAAVPWRADDADLHVGDPRVVGADMGQAHEGRDAREAGQVEARNGLEESVAHRQSPDKSGNQYIALPPLAP